MRTPTPLQVFNTLSALPFLAFIAALNATTSHLRTATGVLLTVACVLLVALPPSSLRDAIRTTVRTTSPSAPDPLPYQRERLVANTLVLLTLLTLLIAGHPLGLHVDRIPLALALPTLALFLLHALAQWVALTHLRTLTALADLDAAHPGRVAALAEQALLRPHAPTDHVRVGPLRLPVGPPLGAFLRRTAPLADLYLRYPHLAWIP